MSSLASYNAVVIPSLHEGTGMDELKGVVQKEYYLLDGQVALSDLVALCVGIAVASINCDLAIGAEEEPFVSSKLDIKDLDALHEICQHVTAKLKPLARQPTPDSDDGKITQIGKPKYDKTVLFLFLLLIPVMLLQTHQGIQG